MNLYDFLRISGKDYDTYDTRIDACVTCVPIEESPDNDYSDRFSIALYKAVEVIPEKSTQSYLCIDWSGLINVHQGKFKAFMKQHWAKQYLDEYDFIYQWIKELHLMLAGYGTDSMYKRLIALIDSLTDKEDIPCGTSKH